jgi:CheY-like chemotaxis protein
MGGRLTSESELGKGSVFTIKVPIEIPESVREKERLSPLRIIGLAPDQPQYRILIVEDSEDSRLLLKKTLKNVGFDIREVENGKKAVEVYQAWHPDLIWMDMRMPVMDGYEATRQIKEMEKGVASDKQTRIIALTAHAFEKERREILEIGCDDFIRKPFQNQDIFQTMAKHLGVTYHYDQDVTGGRDVPTSQEEVLTSKMLAQLPEQLITDLKSAALDLDMKRVSELIEQVNSCDSSIAAALRKFADQFRLREIYEIINTTTEAGGVENDPTGKNIS